MKNITMSLMLASLILSVHDDAIAGGIGDYAAISFSLRFPAALSRFSSYADVAGTGGASVGSRYSSSINPAATDWQTQAEAPRLFSPQISQIQFDSQPDMTISTLAAGTTSDSLGSFLLAVAEIKHVGDLKGNFMLVNGEYQQLQWGKRFAGDIAFGVAINHSSFRTKAGNAGTLVADASSDNNGLRAGVLWQANQQLLAGVVMDSSVASVANNTFDPGCMCFVRSNDRGIGQSTRAGVSYEYAEQSFIYADYLVNRLKDSSGTMNSNILFLGLEHQLSAGLFARAGFAHDFQRSVSSQTIGIGISPSKQSSIDLAIQHDMFPELQPEFGRSTLINLSASFAF